MADVQASGWFGVRCVFRDEDGPESTYEERITVWRAADADEAIRLAEAEAIEYAADVEAEYLGLAQAYAMAGELGGGAEVFSLVRTSPLDPTTYLDTYFDTGAEHQQQAEADHHPAD